MSAYHFLEPTDNGYVTKRYSSFIINESTATEVEENSKEVKIQAKFGCWYAFYLEKYQYWYIGMVLEICNERLTPLKVDFLQQLSQNANLFDSKEEILNVPASSIFYTLHNDPSTISSTRTSCLKLDYAEYKDILENFKESLSKS